MTLPFRVWQRNCYWENPSFMSSVDAATQIKSGFTRSPSFIRNDRRCETRDILTEEEQ